MAESASQSVAASQTADGSLANGKRPVAVTEEQPAKRVRGQLTLAIVLPWPDASSMAKSVLEVSLQNTAQGPAEPWPASTWYASAGGLLPTVMPYKICLPC